MNLSTELFEYEGKQNVAATIRIVADAAAQLEITKVLVFASAAENVLALRKALANKHLVLAVTFPAGMSAKPNPDAPAVLIGMPGPEDRHQLNRLGVPVLQASMPFRGIGETASPTLEPLMRVLSLWGGGMELCVQAALMACDAGYLVEGERCIVMSADTAVILRAGNTFRFLRANSMFSIEHILCKPMRYQISRSKVYSSSSAQTDTIDQQPEATLELAPITGGTTSDSTTEAEIVASEGKKPKKPARAKSAKKKRSTRR